MYYRYIVEELNTGMINGLDIVFKKGKCSRKEYILANTAMDNFIGLNCPDVGVKECRSYFTEEGHNKFLKGIEEMIKLYENKGYTISLIQTEHLPIYKIIYKDKNQVLIKV